MHCQHHGNILAALIIDHHHLSTVQLSRWRIAHPGDGECLRAGYALPVPAYRGRLAEGFQPLWQGVQHQPRAMASSSHPRLLSCDVHHPSKVLISNLKHPKRREQLYGFLLGRPAWHGIVHKKATHLAQVIKIVVDDNGGAAQITFSSYHEAQTVIADLDGKASQQF
eukprot:25038-Amphidinium_carterae.2